MHLDALEVARILAQGADRLGLFGVAHPQTHALAVLGQQVGQGGAETAAAQHGYRLLLSHRSIHHGPPQRQWAHYTAPWPAGQPCSGRWQNAAPRVPFAPFTTQRIGTAPVMGYPRHALTLSLGLLAFPGRRRGPVHGQPGPAGSADRHAPAAGRRRRAGQHQRARPRADPRQRRTHPARAAAPGAGHAGGAAGRQSAADHGQLPRQQRQPGTPPAGAGRRPLGLSLRARPGRLARHPAGHRGHRAHRGVPRPQHRQLRGQRADGGGQHPHPRPARQPRHTAEGDPRPARHRRLVRRPRAGLGRRRPAPVAVRPGRRRLRSRPRRQRVPRRQAPRPPQPAPDPGARPQPVAGLAAGPQGRQQPGRQPLPRQPADRRAAGRAGRPLGRARPRLCRQRALEPRPRPAAQPARPGQPAALGAPAPVAGLRGAGRLQPAAGPAVAPVAELRERAARQPGGRQA